MNILGRRLRASGDSSGSGSLPYADAVPLDETFDDASAVARSYPVVRLPEREVLDKLTGEARWQAVCEGISTHGALSRPYLD